MTDNVSEKRGVLLKSEMPEYAVSHMKTLWTSQVLNMQSNPLKAYLPPPTHLCTNKIFLHVQQN